MTKEATENAAEEEGLRLATLREEKAAEVTVETATAANAAVATAAAIVTTIFKSPATTEGTATTGVARRLQRNNKCASEAAGRCVVANGTTDDTV